MRTLPFLLLLGACATSELPVDPPAAPVPVPPAAVAECKADAAQRYVGQRFIPSLPEGVRIASGSRSVRTIRPGQAVTMDYRGDRVSVQVDARGMVTAVRCG